MHSAYQAPALHRIKITELSLPVKPKVAVRDPVAGDAFDSAAVQTKKGSNHFSLDEICTDCVRIG